MGGPESGVQSENTLSSSPAPYLCSRQGGRVFFLVEADGESDEAGVSAVLGTGTGAFRDWTLSSGVKQRGPACGAQQECGRLISFRGARDPRKEKQTSVQKTQWGPVAYFSCLALLWLADLRLRCRYRVAAAVMTPAI